MSADFDRAYQQGRLACWGGQERSANPYGPRNPLRPWWYKGWDASAEQIAAQRGTPTPGYQRLLASGKAEELRQTVLAEQREALAKAEQRRSPTEGPADQARDMPVWPASHIPAPKPGAKRRRQ